MQWQSPASLHAQHCRVVKEGGLSPGFLLEPGSSETQHSGSPLPRLDERKTGGGGGEEMAGSAVAGGGWLQSNAQQEGQCKRRGSRSSVSFVPLHFLINQDLNKVKSREGDSRWQELAAAGSDKQLRGHLLWTCGKMRF